MKPAAGKKRILFLYYSFSSQTNNLVQSLVTGMENYGVEIIRERIIPVTPLRFPLGSIWVMLKMMLVTFFRKRIPIEPLSPECFGSFDLIILAGPTWSYNPSGPILALFDRDGEKLFRGKKVIPLISCRGYWRWHWSRLKRLLVKKKAIVVNLIVFSHPNPEPWRTIGVFLKLAGKLPEKSSWLGSKYEKYGHTRKQLKEAKRFGKMIAKEVVKGAKQIHLLEFDTYISRP